MDCRRCPLLALPAGAASRALERRRATSRSLIEVYSGFVPFRNRQHDLLHMLAAIVYHRPPAAPAAVWLDRPRQNRQGFHRYLVRLCLAVRGQWFDHAQAPPAGARGVAGAGRAGLDGNRVRGGQVRHHPAQGGRLTPPSLYCKQDIFIFYIQWLIFLLIGNTMKNTMLRKGLTIF